MNNLYTIPIVMSIAIVLLAYYMKKDEQDQNKKPNYAMLFAMSLVVSGSVVYFLGSSEDSINVVMKEIHGGEPNF